jgi:recombination protein RecR
MNSIDKLSEMFAHFPGIGPRQARRFVYYLLSRSTSTLDELARAIQDLKKDTVQCSECMRFFPSTSGRQTQCSICADDTRDNTELMIVSRDIDFEAVEKSGSYKGYYFILGGSLPILDKEPEKRIRIKELESKMKKDQNIREIILGMNANAEGENTADYLREHLKRDGLTISELGRGLSTGAELEYADPETLKSALLHRTK